MRSLYLTEIKGTSEVIHYTFWSKLSFRKQAKLVLQHSQRLKLALFFGEHPNDISIKTSLTHLFILILELFILLLIGPDKGGNQFASKVTRNRANFTLEPLVYFI